MRVGVWRVVLLFWVILPWGAQAEMLRASLRVNGLACPFCAFGIEKKLREVVGVETVDVLLDEGIVQLALKPANRVTIPVLEQAVERAGFELSGLRLAVRGRLVEDSPSTVLDAGSASRFLLLEKAAGRLRPIAGKTAEAIRAASVSGPVIVEGAIDGTESGLRRLVVELFEGTP